jgi:hypothetical protein
VRRAAGLVDRGPYAFERARKRERPCGVAVAGQIDRAHQMVVAQPVHLRAYARLLEPNACTSTIALIAGTVVTREGSQARE